MSPKTSIKSRGVALIAVLWMVAALSLLVASVTEAVKQEIRLTAQQRQGLQTTLRAEAASVRVLQGLKSNPNPPDRVLQYGFEQFGSDVWVSVTPMGAYLDLNMAKRPLLKALFTIAAGLTDAEATRILDGIDVRRGPPGQSTQQVPLETPEDLMQVPGMTFEIYRTIYGLVTTDSGGSGRVNPLAAPPELLLVLTDGNTAAAQAFLANRATKKTNAEIDTSRLNPNFYELSSSYSVKLDVYDAPEQGRRLLSKIVDLQGDTQTGQPWRYLN